MFALSSDKVSQIHLMRVGAGVCRASMHKKTGNQPQILSIRDSGEWWMLWEQR